MSAQEIAERRETGMTMTQADNSPMQMLQTAIANKMDPATIKDLMDLRDRWEATEARKAYVRAMAEFKAEPLSVTKSKSVSFGNGGTAYRHATLADVVDAVVHALSKHGLSHRWDTHQEGDVITVSCVITHEAGHSERTTLNATPDKSGSKNSIQAIGSTVTYLQRYTLMAATGLAAKDMDNDARTAEPVEKISESQWADLNTMLTDTKSDVAKFCQIFGIEKLSDLPASDFDKAVNKLKQKAKKLEQEAAK